MQNRLPHVPEKSRLNFRKNDVAERGPQCQVSQHRKPDFLVEHISSSTDDIPELGIPPQTEGATDVHSSWPIAATVEPKSPDGVGATPAQPEIAAPVSTQQIAVEAAIGKIAGDSASDAQPSPIDWAGRNPERVVVHEA